jgi:hypothetical protein
MKDFLRPDSRDYEDNVVFFKQHEIQPALRSRSRMKIDMFLYYTRQAKRNGSEPEPQHFLSLSRINMMRLHNTG